MPRENEQTDLERAMDVRGQNFVKPSGLEDHAGHNPEDDFEPIPDIRDIEYVDVEEVEDKPPTYAEQIGDRTDVYRGPNTRRLMKAANRKRMGW